jgi:hypothetical protein
MARVTPDACPERSRGDLAGNRKTRTDKRLGTTLTYAYDNIYQLLTAGCPILARSLRKGGLHNIVPDVLSESKERSEPQDIADPAQRDQHRVHLQHDKNGYYRNPEDATDSACKEHDKCYSQCRRDYPCDKTARQNCMRQLCDSALVGDLLVEPASFWNRVVPDYIDFFNGHPDAGDNDNNCGCKPDAGKKKQ